MSIKYTYSILNDTLNSKINTTKLQNEIKTSNIPNTIDFIGTEGDSLDIWFLTELMTDAQITLTNLINSHDGEIDLDLTPQSVVIENVEVGNTEKSLKVSLTKLEGSSSLLISHNFCDKTTWWGESTRVLQETLTPDQYFTIYSSLHTYWIDLVSGKVPYEDKYSTPYKVKIYIDDVETTTGFTINYKTGQVVFDNSQENKTIKASYNYANGSSWIVAPSPGKTLKLLGTEVKVTDDVSLNTHFIFTIYSGSTPISVTTYKNMYDFLVCAKGPVIRLPKFGTLPSDLITLGFDYVTSKDLKSSQNVSIKISTANDIEIQGSLGIMTAYIISVNE